METVAYAVYVSREAAGAADPTTYDAAMRNRDASSWTSAMLAELASIKKNDVWYECTIPDGHKTVGAKWVYKTKRDAKGEIIKHKARIVAKGYSQIPGLHYDETFSPVARLASLRTLLAIAAVDDLELEQMDVETAFLNGTLKEELYVDFPDAYVQKDLKTTGLRLRKTLYGLKQSGREWWEEISGFLVKCCGMRRFQKDWGLYMINDDKGKLYVLVYVDDILIAGNKGKVAWMKAQLSSKWTMSDLGPARWILGIKIERDRPGKSMTLSQTAYVNEITARFGQTDAKSISTPMERSLTLSKTTDDDERVSQKDYQALVGSLM